MPYYKKYKKKKKKVYYQKFKRFPQSTAKKFTNTYMNYRKFLTMLSQAGGKRRSGFFPWGKPRTISTQKGKQWIHPGINKYVYKGKPVGFLYKPKGTPIKFNASKYMKRRTQTTRQKMKTEYLEKMARIRQLQRRMGINDD